MPHPDSRFSPTEGLPQPDATQPPNTSAPHMLETLLRRVEAVDKETVGKQTHTVHVPIYVKYVPARVWDDLMELVQEIRLSQ